MLLGLQTPLFVKLPLQLLDLPLQPQHGLRRLRVHLATADPDEEGEGHARVEQDPRMRKGGGHR